MTDFTPWAQIATTRVEALLNGTWVDITGDVLQSRGIDGGIGRQTELDQVVPSALNFALRNNDGRYTPDNLSSPLSPYWKTGVQIRWTETIGARSFRFPDVFVEVCETSLDTFTDVSDPAHNNMVVNVSCVDLMTRLNRAPRFNSNLGAYILASEAATDLVAYWPLNDPADSRGASPVKGGLNLRPLGVFDDWFPPASDLLVYGAVTGPPGDDSTYVEFNVFEGTSPATLPVRLAQTDVNVIALVGVGQLSVTFWSFIPATASTAPGVTVGNPVTPHFILPYADFTSNRWTINTESDPGFVNAQGPGIAYGRWQLVTGQLDAATGDVKLWIDAAPEASANVGNATTATFSRVLVNGPPGGAFAHVQIRIGTAFDHDAHLAQYEFGMTGLANQTVDARIRTIANFAGIPDSQLDLQPSDSVMPAAAFAGQRPGALLTAAASTGGGLVFTRDSDLVYQDRKHRFNL